MKRDPIKKTKKMNISMGFLGGGQLARMLALASHPLGLLPRALVSSFNDPACPTVEQFKVGDLNNKTDLLSFLKNLDFVTFESEFINASLIEEVAAQTECFIFPKPSLMRLLQNRISQKKTLDQFKIATSPWIEVGAPEHLDLAWKKLGGKFVLKSSFGGYDGNGTFVAQKQSDLGKLSQNIANESQKFIAEKFVPFKRELACIFVRSRNGSTKVLPLVQSQAVNNRCDWVLGPVTHPHFKKVSVQILKMMKSLDYVGAMGVEFFDTGKNLIVNEIAPRVHNSGHYSQDALNFSQFDLHLMAGLGKELPEIQILTKSFVMTNLLGDSEKEFSFPDKLTGKLHWYGKKENRPGRKMGHINYLGPAGKSFLTKALSERKKISR